MAPEAQSCRGSLFVALLLFTQDLRRLSTEESQSTSILPAGSPWIVTVAAWPRPDMGAQDETPGTPDCSGDIRDPLAGMGSCREWADLQRWLNFPGKGQVPAQAMLMLVRGRIAHFLKYTSIG